MPNTPDTTTPRYGWPVTDWAKAVGLCRASVFNLIKANEVETAKVGTKRLVLTHPRDFLQARKSAA